jgi:hypothetical protein
MLLGNRIFKASIYVAAWLAGELAVIGLFRDAPARSVYAGITAWWLGAYVAAKFEIDLRSALLAGVPFWIFYVLQALAGKDWFYRDASALSVPWLLVLAGVAALIFLTPAVFDQAVTWSIRKLFRGSSSSWEKIAHES